MKSEIRPSQPGDYETITGEPLPFRSRALTALVDGKIVGMGGLAYLKDGTIAAFTEITDEARKYPILIHKTGLKAMQEARRTGVKRVVAIADDDIGQACKWLSRLGFKPEIFDETEVWIWQV